MLAQMKQEVDPTPEPLTDDEYEFEFLVDDDEYDEILKELKVKIEEPKEEEKINPDLVCPYPDCQKIFARKYNLTRHMQTHDFASRNSSSSVDQICHVCGKTVKDRNYTFHLKIHEGTKPHGCLECGKEFRTKDALASHKLVHTEERPFECQWCHKRFKTIYSYKDHIKRHTGVSNFICNLCGKECPDETTLEKHSMLHSANKAFQCSICYLSFNHQSSLSRHTKSHSKSVQCHLCHQTFRFESFLKKHLLTAHEQEHAILQPELNPLVKSYKDKYIKEESNQTDQQQECELIEEEFVEDDRPQIIDYQQYPATSSSTIIINNQTYRIE